MTAVVCGVRRAGGGNSGAFPTIRSKHDCCSAIQACCRRRRRAAPRITASEKFCARGPGERPPKNANMKILRRTVGEIVRRRRRRRRRTIGIIGIIGIIVGNDWRRGRRRGGQQCGQGRR